MVLDHREIKLELRVETPLHVWSGVEANLGIDAFRIGNKLCIVDVSSYIEYFTKYMPHLIEKPEEAIKNIPEIVTRYRSDICEREAEIVKLPQESRDSVVRIKLLSRLGVPGSSLKGYIRTALLYWLMEEASKTEDIKSILESGINLDPNPKKNKPQNVSQGLEERFFRKPRPNKQGGFVDALSTILVSDPYTSNMRTMISTIDVYRLSGRSSRGPSPMASILAEFLSPGTLLEYGLSIVKPEPPDLPGEFRDVLELYRAIDAEKIVNAMRAFGCALLDYEISRVSMVERLGLNLGHYKRVLEDLKHRLCSKESNCAPARIGFATAKEYKTVLLHVERSHRELYDRIREYMSRKLGRPWDERSIKLVSTAEGLVGAGWCSLCLTEKK